jgi:hypothetical protein
VVSRGKQKAHPVHQLPLEASVKKVKTQLDDMDIEGAMLNTIPPKIIHELPFHQRYWFWENSVRLHGSRNPINFQDFQGEIRNAVDATGEKLPILISTLIDYKEQGQAYMWSMWFHRKSISKFYIRTNGLPLSESLGPVQCTHYMLKQLHKQAQGKLQFYCLWCKKTSPMPPTHFLFMQMLPAGHVCLTDQQLTEVLILKYRIPSGDVENWQLDLDQAPSDGAGPSNY